ncbi:MAG: nucleotide pyrophosphatase [Candidatus Eisenbacteria bacterium]|nr:nucleotide pyrophosphatase [Candidatus Eisenbacteria bacterium]
MTHKMRAACIGAALAVLCLPSLAQAYVGPGAGFAVVGSLGILFVTFFLALIAIVTWPFRAVYRTIRKRTLRRKTTTKRVIILGLDGLDPVLMKRWMKAGHLPNFQKLAEQGTFTPLATAFPAMSPVAWSTFATGVDASKHNIFDFLNRDLRTHLPLLSSTEIRPPARTMQVGNYEIALGKPSIRLMRKSRSFWQILGEHYVPCHVLRVPITFPPEKVPNGALLSAMCTPDLRGTQGSFTFFTTDHERAAAFEGGTVIPVTREGDTVRAEIPGPPDPIHKDHPVMKIPFTARIDEAAGKVEIVIGKERFTIGEREFSDWTSLPFQAAMGQKVKGIARFRVMGIAPHFELYMTAINLDPDGPAMPISYPGFFSAYLARLNGPYATLGLAEDTWALNERVIDEEAFLDLTWSIREEREKMWFNSLKKNKTGLNVVVFDDTDRIQHTFFRYITDGHPANAGKDTERFKDTMLEMYEKADTLLGKTLEFVDDRTVFFAISDHGFKPFRRGINLNSWFLQNGYMQSKNGAVDRYFDGVDWERTRAYTFGLGGIYINVKGREAQGAVERGEEYRRVKRELIEKLSGLKDPETGETGILRIYDSEEIFRGPYRGDGPDLVVGYNVGYRASWDGAVGAADETVFEDNTKSWSGDHCMDPFMVPGIFFSNRKIETRFPGLIDLGPTVLDLFGVKKPAHMDGISLFDPLAMDKRTSLRDAYFPAGVPEGLRDAPLAEVAAESGPAPPPREESPPTPAEPEDHENA